MDIIKIVQKKRALVTKRKENDNEELNEELKEFKSKKNMDIKIKGDTIVSDKFEARKTVYHQ